MKQKDRTNARKLPLLTPEMDPAKLDEREQTLKRQRQDLSKELRRVRDMKDKALLYRRKQNMTRVGELICYGPDPKLYETDPANLVEAESKGYENFATLIVRRMTTVLRRTNAPDTRRLLSAALKECDADIAASTAKTHKES